MTFHVRERAIIEYENDTFHILALTTEDMCTNEIQSTLILNLYAIWE
jgi:hypothetical protein